MFMLGVTHGPEQLLHGVYAKHAGLPLTSLAAALVATRLFDAITYPLVGYLSDLTARRTGSRKHWLVAGTLTIVIALWFLYRPPEHPTIAYFTIWFMAGYLGWKMTEIPYTAWSFALSADFAQRARVMAWRAAGWYIGVLSFYLMPYLAKALGVTEGTDINFQVLGLLAIFIAVLGPLLNLFTVMRVPDGDPAVIAARAAVPRQNLREAAASVLGNAPLLRLLGAILPMTLGYYMMVGSMYLFIDVYLGLGQQLAAVAAVAFLLTVATVPIWNLLCQRFERHRVLAIAFAGAAAAFAGISLVPPGVASLPVFAVLYVLAVSLVSAYYVAAFAMIGDISDFGRLETGQDHSGIYSALFYFVWRSVGGLVSGLGLAVIGWFGFDATTKAQTDLGIVGIKLVSTGFPALGFAIAAIVLWGFPLTRERHEQIRAELEARAARGR
jgi:glycoside/pentoside/hexuronide:cation symporter, GPH family